MTIAAETPVNPYHPYTTHPVTELFPLLTGTDLEQLTEDIRANGQRVPVLVWNGKLVDGRNRWNACAAAGIYAMTETCDDLTEDVMILRVLSLNLHRRHLSESQRAAVGWRVKPLFEEAARRRHEASLAMPGEKVGEKASANLREPEPRKSTTDAAAVVNVSPRLIEHAGKVITQGVPELVSAVEQGTVAVSAASEIASMPPEEQRQIIEAGTKAIQQMAKKLREEKPKRLRGEPSAEEQQRLADLSRVRQVASMALSGWLAFGNDGQRAETLRVLRDVAAANEHLRGSYTHAQVTTWLRSLHKGLNIFMTEYEGETNEN